MFKKSYTWFTLVEMLIVIVIIGILAAALGNGSVTSILSWLVNDGYIKSLPKDPQNGNQTTFCQNPSNYGGTGGQYLYMRINNAFALSANTEVTKKGNWIPSDSSLTWCITTSSTLKNITDKITSFQSQINGQAETIYIYAN